MQRALLILSLVAAPVLVLLAGSGCEEEQRVHRVERRTTVHESEPQMVSPGEEVVE